jgi:hypothetical protein
MSEDRPPTDDELRAAYEAEIKRVRIEQLILENVVSLVNLGMRRTGLAPGTEDERDLGQVRLAIEAVRALMPTLEQTAPQQTGAIREALSQLQLAYVKIGGSAAQGPVAAPDQAAGASPGAASTPPGEPPPKPGEPGPAQRSGRLWVPGQ